MYYFKDRIVNSLASVALECAPIGDIKVTITPVQIQLKQNKLVPLGTPLKLDYENLDTGGYGISNCIIFRPSGFLMAPNHPLLVEVKGLKTADGQSATLRYVVDFYKL